MKIIEAQEWALAHNKQLLKEDLTPCLIVSGRTDDMFPFLNIGFGAEDYVISFDMTYSTLKERVEKLLKPRYVEINTNCADILGETLYLGEDKVEFKVKSVNIQDSGVLVTSEDNIEAHLNTLWEKL